ENILPVRLWFVPITIHNVDAVDFVDAFEGSCIHLNPVDMISIYFIRHVNLGLGAGFYDRVMNELTIPVTGGVPEIDPDRFLYSSRISRQVCIFLSTSLIFILFYLS